MRYSVRSVLMLAPIAAVATVLLHAQAPKATEQAVPAFDVAAIKPNTSGEPEFGSYVEPGGRYTAKNVTLRTLIKTGYGVHDSQIAGGPSWMDTDRWDVTAKAEGYEKMPSPAFRDTARLMVRPLLADRFKLSLRHESRELPVYALVVAKANGDFGPLFRRNDERECSEPVPPLQPVEGAKEPAVPLPCGADMFRPGHLAARAMTLNNILVALARFSTIDRVVVDRTGLTGKFDWEIQWTPEALSAGTPAANDGLSVFQAFRDQAGLKLDARKALVDVLVIDHVERPATD